MCLQAGFEQILTLVQPGRLQARATLSIPMSIASGLISAQYSLAGAVGLVQVFHRFFPDCALVLAG